MLNLNMFKLTKNWYEVLKPEFEKPYYKKLEAFLNEEYASHTIYPVADRVFAALNAVKYDDVKVVILGQDPYHEPNQAEGLSFSVPKETKIPPSLVNIYKEIEADIGKKCANHGQLYKWARQGVLLLNSVLTVRKGQAFSHAGKGWEELTGAVIQALNEREKPLVFIAWGASAKKVCSKVDTSKHLVLTSVHPSPLSAWNGFFGCKHFSKTNEFLQKNGQAPIDWVIE